MKTLLLDLKTSVLATIVLVVIVSGVYPIAVWAAAQGLFPRQANGSLLVENGTTIGSSAIAQGFTGEQYFHPRPSAAGSGYDAAASSGSNLGPLSKKLLDAVAERTTQYRTINGLAADATVPADAVTASGSGLDPHISLENAALQAPRVAKARGLSLERAQELIEEHTDDRWLGFIGDPGVNVLTLNLALDKAR